MTTAFQSLLYSLYMLVLSAGFAVGVSPERVSFESDDKASFQEVPVSKAGILVDQSADSEDGDGHHHVSTSFVALSFHAAGNVDNHFPVPHLARYELQPRSSQGPPYWSV